MSLAHRIVRLALRVATENARDYLLSLNLKALQKTVKKGPQDDPRTFYEGLRKRAEDGPLFDAETLYCIKELELVTEKDVTQWLGNQLQQDKNLLKEFAGAFRRMQGLVRLIAEYVEEERPNLPKLTFEQASEAALEWSDRRRGLSSKVVKKWGNGFTMVRLGPEDCEAEGKVMQNCLKDPGWDDRIRDGETEVYSLRDAHGKPHVSIEVRPAGVIGRGTVEQIRGKQNDEPLPKYHPYIGDWLSDTKRHNTKTIVYLNPKRAEEEVDWRLRELKEHPRRAWETGAFLQELLTYMKIMSAPLSTNTLQRILDSGAVSDPRTLRNLKRKLEAA